jgi:hypothetical protein
MARESRKTELRGTAPKSSGTGTASRAAISRFKAKSGAYGSRGAVRDKETIPFGTYRATIYRRSDVGTSSYFMRMYLKEEGRYFRKSLGTQDRKQAKERLTTELLTIA